MKHPQLRALVPAPNGGPPQLRQLTLPSKPVAEFLSSFMEGNTRRAYTRDLADFFQKPGARVGMPEVLTMAPPDVATFRDGLLLQKLKPGTVARKLSAVRCFYDYLLARGAVPYNPAHAKLVRSPKRPNLMKTDSVSWNQALALLSAPDRTTRIGRRDYALLMLDIHLGLRRSELVAIRTEDLKPGPPAPHIYFRGKGEKDRRVEIRPDLFEVLEDYHEDVGEAEEYLFPSFKGHISGTQFWRIVKRYAAAAGLPKNIHPHSLRAAFVTFGLEAGVSIPDIQRAVGHSRPETTLGYARDLEQVKSKATRALDGLKAGAALRAEQP